MKTLVERNLLPASAESGADMQCSAQPTRVNSRLLLGDSGELLIEHAGREYRLRVTQNGKLILTA